MPAFPIRHQVIGPNITHTSQPETALNPL
jgi:hypothetical protein